MFLRPVSLAGWLVCLISLSLAVALGQTMGLTYDEAVNYLLWSSRGPWVALTDYSYPNNHIFFTLLNSFILSDDLLHTHLQFIRLPNIAYTVFAMGGAWAILRQAGVPAYQRPWWLMASFFGSLISIEYIVLSRGYMLGTGLTLWGIWAWKHTSNPVLAAVCWALASWTVPTFGYVVPGLFVQPIAEAMLTQRSHIRPALWQSLQAAIIYFGFICAFYAPVWQSLVQNSSRYGDTSPFNQIVNRLTNLNLWGPANWGPETIANTSPNLLAVAACLTMLTLAVAPTGAILIILKRKSYKLSPHESLQTTLTAALLSYGIFAYALPALGGLHYPFYRNATLLPILLGLAIGVSMPFYQNISRHIPRGILVFLALNTAAGILALAMATPFYHQTDNLSQTRINSQNTKAILYVDYSPTALLTAQIFHIPAYRVFPQEVNVENYQKNCSTQGLEIHPNMNSLVRQDNSIQTPCIPIPPLPWLTH